MPVPPIQKYLYFLYNWQAIFYAWKSLGLCMKWRKRTISGLFSLVYLHNFQILNVWSKQAIISSDAFILPQKSNQHRLDTWISLYIEKYHYAISWNKNYIQWSCLCHFITCRPVSDKEILSRPCRSIPESVPHDICITHRQRQIKPLNFSKPNKCVTGIICR